MPTACDADAPLRLTEDLANDLAAAYGTPLYVLSEPQLRARIRRYWKAFRDAYPSVQLSYASKANSTLAVLAIAHAEGCLIDVASEGELRAALSAGVPAQDCEFHGNNKSVAELRFALDEGIRTIAIDNFEEIEKLRSLRTVGTHFILRLAPGVDPLTHRHISTGQEDTKFGFNVSNGDAEKALKRCLELTLDVKGLHCHVGSQLIDPVAQMTGGEVLASFAVEMRDKLGFSAQILNLGGGLAVSYRKEDQPLELEKYCQVVVEPIKRIVAASGLSPTLMQEPGRALVAEAGVTLYTVGVVKDAPIPVGVRTFACVDGGLSDNPRPALYNAPYALERTSNPHEGPTKIYTVSGKHCETDELFPNVELPADLKPGDILQVFATGAYNSSMASNYNRFSRPATVLLRGNGSHMAVQRRETWEDQVSRETLPADLGELK